jgi:predicted DsbA family dithiol-disulfide isomerase
MARRAPGQRSHGELAPFFLNPDTPEAGEPYRPFLEKKFGGPQGLAEIWQRVREAGKPAGIDFAFEKIELRANTLAAHRLIHWAQKSYVPAAGDGILFGRRW